MLHAAPFSSYTVLASANSEASDWRPTGKGAHRLLFARFFYVRSSLPLRADCAGSLRTRRFPLRRYANLHSLPTPIGVGTGRFLNLVKETAMHDCIAHCPVCGRKFPIPVLGNLDQKVEIRCVCGHTFRVGIEELAVSQKLVSPATPAPVQNQKENVMEKALINLTTASIGGEQQKGVSARDLHAFLEVKSRFNDWIANRIKDFDFVENQDYLTLTKKIVSGGLAKEYLLTLHMAKELSMVERNEKGKQARQYFIQCEKQLKVAQQQFAIPQTLPEALRLAADLADKNAALEKKAKEDAPKVEFCDKVVADNDAMTITRAAKLINYPPRKLKDYIRQIGWLYANSDTPMQSTITSGYMVLRFAHWTDNEGNAVEKPYAHITNKGLFALYRRMRREGLIEKNEQLELAA